MVEFIEEHKKRIGHNNVGWRFKKASNGTIYGSYYCFICKEDLK